MQACNTPIPTLGRLAIVVRVEEAIEALRGFNREQLAINARLETLVTRVLRNDAENGRDAPSGAGPAPDPGDGTAV